MTHRTTHSSRQGFTLIELSIVLVIIGLVVGGILVGRDLIHAAELKKVISEVDKFESAFNTFRVKYNFFPGDIDCKTAQQYFPSATCNGSASNTGQLLFSKGWQTWEQLSLAGLIPGQYIAGYQAGHIGSTVLGYNIPASAAIPTVGFLPLYDNDTNYANSSPYPTTNSNWIRIATTSAGGAYISGIWIGAVDALAIDTKADDGIAFSGKWRPAGSGCTQYWFNGQWIDDYNLPGNPGYVAANANTLCYMGYRMSYQ